jgi:hypothetical protein
MDTLLFPKFALENITKNSEIQRSSIIPLIQKHLFPSFIPLKERNMTLE